MADIYQLENKMRQLKLNGMLDTLELRLSQAQKESLGFIQFLEILLEDEGQRRADKRLARWITHSIPRYPLSTLMTWLPAGLLSGKSR